MASKIVPPAADAVTEEWQRLAYTGLSEAQVAGESIATLIETLIEDSDASSFALLEAVKSCVMRQQAALAAPLDFTLSREVAHG